MAEYQSMTIYDLIDKINNQELILPAMQRNFVWPEEKIYHLFDSLIRDYPIGTFLFWDVKKEAFEQYAFNQFIKDVQESKDKLYRGPAVIQDHSRYSSVLDGQQRITSIYIGIMGKWKTHEKRKKWEDPNSYYDRYLCIDFLYYPETEEDEYLFRFIQPEKIEKLYTDDDNTKHYWVKVSKIFGINSSTGEYIEFDSADYTDDFCSKNPNVLSNTDRKNRRKTLDKLHNALHINNSVNYFEAKNKSLAEVIEIFVRVNSGGQKLSASDLMLSIASGTLGNTDIHVKMQNAINAINSSVKDTMNGFKVDKELILQAGLMATNAPSLSLKKKENYERDQIDTIFQSSWDNIVDSLSTTLQYIEHLGFNGNKLSKSIVLSIFYYFYKNNLSPNHFSSNNNRASCDRIFIRQWMIRAMINNVFMDGTGSTLIHIRELIDSHSQHYFPLDKLMQRKIKQPLTINDTQIDEILDYKYGDSRIIPLFMDLSYRSTDTYQLDHIWPKSLISTKKAIYSKYPNASDTEIKKFQYTCDRIANLQLLTPRANQEKS